MLHSKSQNNIGLKSRSRLYSANPNTFGKSFININKNTKHVVLEKKGELNKINTVCRRELCEINKIVKHYAIRKEKKHISKGFVGKLVDFDIIKAKDILIDQKKDNQSTPERERNRKYESVNELTDLLKKDYELKIAAPVDIFKKGFDMAKIHEEDYSKLSKKLREIKSYNFYDLKDEITQFKKMQKEKVKVNVSKPKDQIDSNSKKEIPKVLPETHFNVIFGAAGVDRASRGITTKIKTSSNFVNNLAFLSNTTKNIVKRVKTKKNSILSFSNKISNQSRNKEIVNNKEVVNYNNDDIIKDIKVDVEDEDEKSIIKEEECNINKADDQINNNFNSDNISDNNLNITNDIPVNNFRASSKSKFKKINYYNEETKKLECIPLTNISIKLQRKV